MLPRRYKRVCVYVYGIECACVLDTIFAMTIFNIKYWNFIWCEHALPFFGRARVCSAYTHLQGGRNLILNQQFVSISMYAISNKTTV